MKPILALLLLFICAGILQASEVLDKASQLVSKKKNGEALQLLKSYDRTHPNDVDVQEMIQKIMKKEGKEAEALSEYKQKYQNSPTGLNAYLYARLLDSPSEQEKIYRAVIEKDPASPWG